MNFSIFVLILAFSGLIALSQGLKCYVCDGNAVCEGTSMGELKDCSELSYAGQNPNPNLYKESDYTCLKTERNGKTSRSCGIITSTGRFGCHKGICTCNRDGCNGSRKLVSGGFALTTLTIIIILQAVI